MPGIGASLPAAPRSRLWLTAMTDDCHRDDEIQSDLLK